MKSLNAFIQESILDDENTLLDETGEKHLISQFLKDNICIKKSHKIKIYRKNDEFYVDYTGDVVYTGINNKLSTLTNGLFKWGKVKGNFSASCIMNLSTLEGAPEEVTKSFFIDYNNKLTSLKGAPKKIGLDFNASDCYGLKTLDCPDTIVGRNLYLDSSYKLTSLKNGPTVLVDCSIHNTGIHNKNRGFSEKEISHDIQVKGIIGNDIIHY